MKRVTREGPVAIEIVRHEAGTTLNVFVNGMAHSSQRMQYVDISMPEALIWLAAEIRMGHILTKEKQ